MGEIRLKLDETADAGTKAPRFSPAGQSTQLIVGADDSSDASIMDTADTLYRFERRAGATFEPLTADTLQIPHASGAQIVCTYHPAAILRADPANADILRQHLVGDLRRARELAD